MPKFYAVLLAGRVVGVKQLAAAIEAPGHVEIESLDQSLIGMLYEGGEFVPAPQEPEQITQISRLEFMDRFDKDLAGVFAAAKANPDVEVWVEKVKAASSIDLTDPRTVSGVQALETAGLIAVGRADEILATQ